MAHRDDALDDCARPVGEDRRLLLGQARRELRKNVAASNHRRALFIRSGRRAGPRDRCVIVAVGLRLPTQGRDGDRGADDGVQFVLIGL